MSTKTKNLILVFAIMFIAAFIPALIFDKWIESFMFILCHWTVREQFPKQYHHVLPSVCRGITALVMFFGVSFLLPIELSLCSAIPINYFVSWVGFIKKELDDLEVKCLRLQEKLIKTPLQEMLDKCAKAKLSDRDTKLAIMYYIERKTPKDIWLWLCEQRQYEQVEWDTVYQILWRIGKKNKFVEDL